MDSRQRFTSRVRRGFAELARRGLDRHVEEAIANATAPHLRRSDRMTAAHIEDLRSAVRYIAQEGASQPDEVPTPAA